MNASRPQLMLQSHDNASDVLEVLSLEPIVSGEHRHVRQADFEKLRPGVTLMPDAAGEVWTAEGQHMRSHLVRGDGWTLYVRRYRGATTSVRVSAVRPELAEAVLAELTEDIELPPAEGTVPIGFWHCSTSSGPVRNVRPIRAPSWQSIRGNYAPGVARAMDRLCATKPDDVYGRLILLHGPPGTGKTTALRSLAHEWRDWCEVDCVLDPDQLFDRTDYLMETVTGEDDDEATGKWRLILLEDCDELIRAEAKSATGQALSRLLSLTDGMLGQGRDVLVAITTNEDLGRLHPAVIRPGRAMARIEVGPLPHDQAVAWLGRSDGVHSDGATLAELYALQAGHMPSEHAGSGGFYL